MTTVQVPMVDTRGKSLWQLIDERATLSPDVIMAVDEAERTMTFGEYRSWVLRVAAGLHDLGVHEGTNVSWIQPSKFETLVLAGALAYLGAVQNPILPIYRHREVAFIARQSACKIIIVPTVFRGFDYPPMVREATADLNVQVIAVERNLPEGDPAVLPPPASNIGDPVRWLFYTSGTTADPKGAKHTDSTMSAANDGMQWAIECTPDDRSAVVFPITHVGGLIWLFNTMQTAVRLVMVETFGPTTPKFLGDRGVTCAGAGTVFWLAYLNAQRALPEGTKLLPNVRLFNGGGAPKPDTLHYEMLEAFGAPVMSGWGLTESPINVMVSLTDTDERKATTEGRAVPGTLLRVVDVDGVELSAGLEGELRVKGPQVCKGYLDSTLDVDGFDADGWFRTGDLGTIDADGYVKITGRLKDIIIRKGENISAAEIENVLYTHPSIADVAVIGVPDRDSGERCCAVVVLKPGTTLGFEEMQDHLKKSSLAVYKIPEQIEFLNALPRNASGKVLKKDLRATFGGSPKVAP